MEISTNFDLPQGSSSIPVHGPKLSGTLRIIAILIWIALFGLSLVIFFHSVLYINLRDRTPYTSLSVLEPTYNYTAIYDTVMPYQKAIFELGLTLDGYGAYFLILRLLGGLPFFIVSLLIIIRRNDRLMAGIFALSLAILGAACTVYNPIWWWIAQRWPWNETVFHFMDFLLGCTIIILYIFPDGRFVPRWTAWMVLFIVPYSALSNLLPEESVFQPWNLLGSFDLLPPVLFQGIGLFSIVYRYLRVADAVQRQQIKWFIAGSTLIILSWFIDFAVWSIYPALTGEHLIQSGRQAVLWELFQDTSWYVAQFLLAVTIAISVFRYRLWDIDLVINRVLVYGTLTIATLLAYVLMVALAGWLFGSLAGETAFFLTIGLVALFFEPVRQRAQRTINRLMYGERDDPYAVLTRLSAALASARSTDEILPGLCRQISQALKIPYVAITMNQDGQEILAASHGTFQPNLLEFPLSYQDQIIGNLQVSRRAPDEGFSTSDQRLLQNISKQASAVTQNIRLYRQLVNSRVQLVNEREEERLRIRRDLHDELGPVMASLALKLAAARQLIRPAPESAETLVDEVTVNSQELVKQIRNLVHGLRPPALDQLGLVEALLDHTRQSSPDRLHNTGMAIEVLAPPNGLPDLPAAVEVNTYRLILEALANAARHAHARHCLVSLQVEENDLVVEITDDGVGLPKQYREGVGLRSMRERAEEVGGSLSIHPHAPQGTQITARLPLST